jgi:hypothetical protein
MLKHSIPLLLACNAPFLIGCFGSPKQSDGQPPPTDPACQYNSKGNGEASPGYPFDIAKFESDVQPVLAKSCGAQGCHGAPTGNSGFIVWSAAKRGDCEFVKGFNSFVGKVDLTTATNSAVLTAVNGGLPAHPFKFDATSPDLAKLQSFVSTAATTFASGSGGGGVVAGPGPSPFDYKVFQSTIEPAFATCAGSGCHSAPGAGDFNVKFPPAADQDHVDNFKAITGRTNLQSPSNSLIYLQATVTHGSGRSRTIDPTAAAAVLQWINDAKGNAGTNPNPTCAPTANFNLGSFSKDIIPILNGSLDLNIPGGQGRGPGCMSTACHGVDRGPGKLSLVASAEVSTQLQNFACFVNLASPSTSEILLCPLNQFGCRKQPHPGQDVLGGNNDLNYQRLLAFVYGAKVQVTPLDFAFFVRNVNPIFSDINSVQGGALGKSCADTQTCHGVSVAGQAPPNNSNFPILPNATGLDLLTANFVSAAAFVNFLNPGESSLFLYPSNEIANRAAHPFATGIDHPGGLDFAVDSDQARAILTWAGALRPDGQGFNRNWLVVGDFAASQITDQTALQEDTVTPQIFDSGGGSFNIGQWDGFFSTSANVDFNVPFPRAATSGRVAYAVAYIVNTTPRLIKAQIQFNTNNPIRVYVDNQLIAQNNNSGGTAAFATLNPAGTGKAVKVLVKLLQRANDNNFRFQAQFSDQQTGIAFTDATRELVFTLGPNGGL